MNHKELQLLVSSYVDNEVIESDKAKVLKHLEVCSDCRQFVEHAKYIREDIRALGEAELQYTFATRIAHLVEKNIERDIEWLGIEPLARNTFYAIVAVVFLMFVLTSYNNASTPGIAEQLFSGQGGDSITTHVLLQTEDISKSDLLYAVMTK